MHRKGMLGIVGCYCLSDQIIHLIDRDESIENVFVLKNEEGVRFANKARDRSINRNIVLVEKDKLTSMGSNGFSILLWLNPEWLHDQPPCLQQQQNEALWKISSHVDSVFFCYGLCRSSEPRIKQMIDESPVPLTYLTDQDGEVVDDCFAAIIGGKKEYLDCITKHKDTLLVTTGYAESWRRKREALDIESIVREVDGLRYMFRELGYSRLLKLDDGTGDAARFDSDVQAFSCIFDLDVNTRKCRLAVFESSYELAKERMQAGRRILNGSDVPSMEPVAPGLEAEMPGRP